MHRSCLLADFFFLVKRQLKEGNYCSASMETLLTTQHHNYRDDIKVLTKCKKKNHRKW